MATPEAPMKALDFESSTALLPSYFSTGQRPYSGLRKSLASSLPLTRKKRAKNCIDATAPGLPMLWLLSDPLCY
ncbi:unnamed protein product [Musa acuminata subsp. malaccensis]|uniref:(wild Malaysian banana) hypothetical protein n=1 Tax=Musa acuminata subsp. malaccensis TaxID=214687 RepID=A0A804KFM6_MUSAM|nr:unnamed protein product [Musa acuminata subsp. malaccensis]